MYAGENTNIIPVLQKASPFQLLTFLLEIKYMYALRALPFSNVMTIIKLLLTL